MGSKIPTLNPEWFLLIPKGVPSLLKNIPIYSIISLFLLKPSLGYKSPNLRTIYRYDHDSNCTTDHCLRSVRNLGAPPTKKNGCVRSAEARYTFSSARRQKSRVFEYDCQCLWPFSGSCFTWHDFLYCALNILNAWGCLCRTGGCERL